MDNEVVVPVVAEGQPTQEPQVEPVVASDVVAPKKKQVVQIPKFKGIKYTVEEFESRYGVTGVQALMTKLEELASANDFVIEGIGKFYFMKSKGGKSYFKVNSKFKR